MAAISAASLHTLAISAPVKPCVSAASCLASSVFPTITGAGMPSVLTGYLPGRHGIPSLYFFDRETGEYPVLYTALEALTWNKWLAPDVQTIYEHFEGDNDTLSIGPALNRGADATVPVVWNVQYQPMAYRAKAQLAVRKIKRQISGEPPARLTVVYNGWFDHMEHVLGAEAEELMPHYESVDALIGETVDLFNQTVDERAKAIGQPVDRYIALVSDHGHQDIEQTISLDEWMHDVKKARVLDKVWTRMFGVTVAGSTPEDFRDREIVVAAGEGHALFYLPTPIVDEAGEVTGLDWSKRPTIEMLRDYPYSSGRVDMLGEAARLKEAVGFVVVKDWAKGVVWVVNHLGEATIERQGEGSATRADYRYTVVTGEDPLGLSATTALVDGAFHSADTWQEATAAGEYPDAVVQLVQAFDYEKRAPDMYLSAKPLISIGDLVDGAASASKHGGLTKEETWSTVAFHGTGIAPASLTTARNVDVVPTMLHLLDVDFDEMALDGQVLPGLRRAETAEAD